MNKPKIITNQVICAAHHSIFALNNKITKNKPNTAGLNICLSLNCIICFDKIATAPAINVVYQVEFSINAVAIKRPEIIAESGRTNFFSFI